jgi:predicted dehydrogenase
MRVGIVGAGLIGQERIKALLKIKESVGSIDIVGFFDPSQTIVDKLSGQLSLKSFLSLESLLSENLDWVFIAVPHDMTVTVAISAINSGANILVEKPLGRSLEEAEKVIAKAKQCGKKINVGMNYRFFRGVAALIDDVKRKKFGDIISAKFVLAHGNSPGMEKSWKLSKERCGGGCLIDPGIHIFDLIDCVVQGEKQVHSVSDWKGFWNTGIEEEVHMILRSQHGTVITGDISLNRWRSEFSICINGTEGYGRVKGRGRSYGNQEYVTGTRWAWQDGCSQAESERVIVNNYDASDSFYWETVAVLDFMSQFDEEAQLIYPEPATFMDALKSMQVMNRCQNLIGQHC